MRVKRGVAAHKKKRRIRQATKGMSHANQSSYKRGKQTVTRALQHAYRDRKLKKRTMRQLWNVRINAAARLNGTTYSKLMAGLKKNNIGLDRKVLSEIAVSDPKAFSEIVKKSK